MQRSFKNILTKHRIMIKKMVYTVQSSAGENNKHAIAASIESK